MEAIKLFAKVRAYVAPTGTFLVTVPLGCRLYRADALRDPGLAQLVELLPVMERVP